RNLTGVQTCALPIGNADAGNAPEHDEAPHPPSPAESGPMGLGGPEPPPPPGRFKSAPAATPLPHPLPRPSHARTATRNPTLIRGFWGWGALHPQNDRAVAALPHPCALREHALGQPPLSDLVASDRLE